MISALCPIQASALIRQAHQDMMDIKIYKARCRKERLSNPLQQLYLNYSRSPGVNPEPLLNKTKGHCLELTMTAALGPVPSTPRRQCSHTIFLQESRMFSDHMQMSYSCSTVYTPRTQAWWLPCSNRFTTFQAQRKWSTKPGYLNTGVDGPLNVSTLASTAVEIGKAS